jgi:hypothetical protein
MMCPVAFCVPLDQHYSMRVRIVRRAYVAQGFYGRK